MIQNPTHHRQKESERSRSLRMWRPNVVEGVMTVRRPVGGELAYFRCQRRAERFLSVRAVFLFFLFAVADPGRPRVTAGVRARSGSTRGSRGPRGFGREATTSNPVTPPRSTTHQGNQPKSHCATMVLTNARARAMPKRRRLHRAATTNPTAK